MVTNHCNGSRATQHRPRIAFTITEMLVSVAVIMLIMAIVSEAFVAGMESFRQFKAIGDLDQRLRTASIVLRRDLQADHFNAPPARLSSFATPPPQGYFYIDSGTATQTGEGSDADSVPSFRGNGAVLAFTVNWSKGGGAEEDPHLMRLENYLSANVPAGSPLAGLSPAQFQDGSNFLSQSAEVAYFLTSSGRTTPGGTPLFRLHRRQRLLLTPSDATSANGAGVNPGDLAKYYDVAVRNESGALHFHTLTDVATSGERTLAPSPAALTGSEEGTDIILYDVISFTVRVFPDQAGITDFQNVTAFDSATAPYNIKAIEITLRVWDVKTSTTRQITVVQDM
ncbi:MAG: type II secretion system protein J [Gemmataceae bacterium]